CMPPTANRPASRIPVRWPYRQDLFTKGFCMTRMARLFIGVLGVFFGSLVGANQGGAGQDDKALQGTWRVTHGEQSGKKFSDEQLREAVVIFEGGLMTAKAGNRTVSVNKYTLGPTAKPKTIDVTGLEGATEGL